jgi:hypothetical protein
MMMVSKSLLDRLRQRDSLLVKIEAGRDIWDVYATIYLTPRLLRA